MENRHKKGFEAVFVIFRSCRICNLPVSSLLNTNFQQAAESGRLLADQSLIIECFAIAAYNIYSVADDFARKITDVVKTSTATLTLAKSGSKTTLKNPKPS